MLRYEFNIEYLFKLKKIKIPVVFLKFEKIFKSFIIFFWICENMRWIIYPIYLFIFLEIKLIFLLFNILLFKIKKVVISQLLFVR